MAKQKSSQGKCIYCNQMFSQSEIGKHISKHLTEKEKTDAGAKPKNFFHIEVEADEMFLHLLVKGNIKMESVDFFLRGIWLECCGHMSGFGNSHGEIDMNEKVQNVFAPGIKIYHDYDYGSTTRIFLKGLNNYQLNLKESLLLLSRNEPLKIMCSICKTEPAVNLCSICFYDEESFFCESCSEKHGETCEDFADYSCMPIVNSPRMGVCGYEGGTIDVERDGVYRKT